jgi:ABC-type multidrug transport system fused ATPase/permease subunit
MISFRRALKYVWRQWPSLVVVIASALTISVLFSLSFVTIIPLLKVMMGEEGLHGWVDRKVCEWRYGVDFFVPETVDFTEGPDTNIAYHLRITRTREGSLAEKAGLETGDRIIGAGRHLLEPGTYRIDRSRLLEEIATAEDDTQLTVQYLRVRPDNTLERKTVRMDTGRKKPYMDHAQYIVSFMPREGGASNKQKAVVLIILAMGAVTIVRCGARFVQGYMAEKVVQTAITHLREDIFAHTLELPETFYAARGGTSDTISRIMGDVNGIGKGLKILLGKALREPLKALGTLICAMLINFKLTLIFLCAAPAALALGVIFGRKIKKATTKALRSVATMLAKVSGILNSLRVVKVYNRQEAEKLAYRQINERLLKQTLRLAKVDAATSPVMEVLGMIAGSAALLVGVHLVIDANMQSSTFFGLLILLGTTAESARKSSDVWNSVQSANAAAERAMAIIDEPVEFEKPGAAELGPLRNRIEFKDVVFFYPGSNRPALNGVNLTVKAGHNIAVVGPNGSGKTTLVNLVPRFYDVSSGAVLIDGSDIRDGTLKSLRGQIAMVTQNVVTFNDTIAANISYGKPGASREEIIAAAKTAHVDEFVSLLPEGYDTVIGEQGLGLSGGQLQRIVIARAILKDPPIVIFDEAMSQIDADSEAKIHDALEHIMRNRTSFIIAHRFSTVITADLIAVMDAGKIVAEGRHEQLMRTCGLYQSLYETQLIAT